MSDPILDADLREATRCALLGLPLPRPKRRLSDDELLCAAQDSIAAWRALLQTYTPRLRHLIAMRSYGPMDDADRADMELAASMNPLLRRRLQRTPQLTAALEQHGIKENDQ